MDGGTGVVHGAVWGWDEGGTSVGNKRLEEVRKRVVQDGKCVGREGAALLLHLGLERTGVGGRLPRRAGVLDAGNSDFIKQ